MRWDEYFRKRSIKNSTEKRKIFRVSPQPRFPKRRIESVEQSVDLRSSENDLANPALSVFRRPFCVLLYTNTNQLPSFPRRRESRLARTGTYRIKRFLQLYVLDSRLRGNDGIQSIAASKMKQAGYDGTTAVENQYRLRFFRFSDGLLRL